MNGGRKLAWEAASSTTLAKLLRRSALARLTRASATVQRRAATPDDVAEAQDEAAHSLRWLMEEAHSKKSELVDATAVHTYMAQGVRRLAKGEPLAYVLGHAPFGPIDKLVCRRPTLIPRPETEEWAVRLTGLLTEKLRDHKGSYRILDMCTGSGCIALLLATVLKEASASISVTAADVHPSALALAAENAALLNFSPTSSPSVSIKHCDIFSDSDLDKISEGRSFNLIVCNPPYIPSQDWQGLDSSVREWEDRGALVGDSASVDQATGLAFYERIAALVSVGRLLCSTELGLPVVVLEVGIGQAASVEEMLRRAGMTRTEVWKDAWSIDRVVLGWLAPQQ